MISKYDDSAVVEIATVFEPVYHVACQRVLRNGTFWTYILPRFPECVISEKKSAITVVFFFENIQNLM